MGARRNLAESGSWQKPAARSKFRCFIIKIRAGRGFWKAALRITPSFRQPDLDAAATEDLMALSAAVATYVGAGRNRLPRQQGTL
jgi:hypothetical protein